MVKTTTLLACCVYFLLSNAEGDPAMQPKGIVKLSSSGQKAVGAAVGKSKDYYFHFRHFHMSGSY